MTRYGFVFNCDTCADHRGCMVACKKKTESFIGSHFIDTHTAMGGEYPKPNTYFVPVVCQHCAEPKCVAACPKGVLYKREDGIVAVGDTAACEACADKPCLKECRLGAIDLDPVSGRIGKCDMCADIIDEGGIPACARGCFTRSIMFGDFDDPGSVVSQVLAGMEGTPALHRFAPPEAPGGSVYYILTRKEWQGAEGLYSPAWHNA